MTNWQTGNDELDSGNRIKVLLRRYWYIRPLSSDNCSDRSSKCHEHRTFNLKSIDACVVFTQQRTTLLRYTNQLYIISRNLLYRIRIFVVANRYAFNKISFQSIHLPWQSARFYFLYICKWKIIYKILKKKKRRNCWTRVDYEVWSPFPTRMILC